MHSTHRKNKACVYFHQGWTDIIMCLGLINYYSSLYDKISVIVRSDARNIVDFYIRGLNNVSIVYIDTDSGRYYGNIHPDASVNSVTVKHDTILLPIDYDICFHGEHDKYRQDIYRMYWSRADIAKIPTKHFSEAFYEYYDIDFNTRISSFKIIRDVEAEDKLYQEFIAKHGTDYVIYHDDQNNSVSGSHHINTCINFKYKLPGHAYVNTNRQSNVIFDYIKIIQNAKEIHFVDSIWGCAYYQLDAKYNILNGAPVIVYCDRGHENLFKFPVQLNNWTLHTAN